MCHQEMVTSSCAELVGSPTSPLMTPTASAKIRKPRNNLILRSLNTRRGVPRQKRISIAGVSRRDTQPASDRRARLANDQFGLHFNPLAGQIGVTQPLEQQPRCG